MQTYAAGGEVGRDNLHGAVGKNNVGTLVGVDTLFAAAGSLVKLDIAEFSRANRELASKPICEF